MEHQQTTSAKEEVENNNELRDFVIQVHKKHGNVVRQRVKKLGIQNISPVIKKEPLVWIPLSRKPSEAEINEIKQGNEGEIIELELIEVEIDPETKYQNVVSTPFDNMLAILKKDNFPTELKEFLPKKYERIGHVIIVKKVDELRLWEEKIAHALLSCLKGALTFLIDEEGIVGELRQPKLKLILDLSKQENPTETVHIENSVKYMIDVRKCMFASGTSFLTLSKVQGNGTERIHFSQITAKDEVIVDMFAGIGYFTIPLCLHSKLKLLICIEKNPDSFYYLNQNIQINGVSHVAKPHLGDNREQGNEYIGKADRVLMGYIPTPKQFLHRAFSFLKPEGGIIHYHLTCMKEEFNSLAGKHIEEELSSFDKTKKFVIEGFRVVKSYSPKQWHCVADIRILNKLE